MASVKDGGVILSPFKGDVDLVARQSGLGDLTTAAANALYGINHRGVGNPVQYNTDNHGLTFFTRPRLNLSYDNIAMDRVLTPLLTNAEYTYQRAIRTLLDPVGANAHNNPVRTPLVDHKSAFIPMLTNNLLSLSGWPDPVVGYYNSKEGPAKESWSMIDDVARNFGTFDLQASFRNIAGDPITLLFNTWIRYAARVYDGTLMPYPDSILENEIDYMTRIYRLVLDPTRQYVQKIAACGAAFPTSSALGAAFNFSTDTPFSQDNAQQISIPFHCIGVDYQDPILIEEFNFMVKMFNPDMADDKRDTMMQKLTPAELNYFNYHGYPYIRHRPSTTRNRTSLSNELEWWVPKTVYAEMRAQQPTQPKAIPYTGQQTPPSTP